MKRMKQSQVDEWNATYPVGSPCTYRDDIGREIETHTRSKLWLIAIDPRTGAGIPVINLDGVKSSAWSLERVRMMETHRISEQP